MLKPNGKALIYVPFIFPIHTHQTDAFLVDDFFRYSASSLRRIFGDAGFSDVRVEPLGGLMLVIGEFLCFGLRFRFLKFVTQATCVGLQRLIERLKPIASAEKFPLGYFIIARK